MIKLVHILSELLKKGYTDIFFMDDSEKNIKAVDTLKNKYPNVNLRTVHVK